MKNKHDGLRLKIVPSAKLNNILEKLIYQRLSRRKFFKITAGALLAGSSLLSPGPCFPQNTSSETIIISEKLEPDPLLTVPPLTETIGVKGGIIINDSTGLVLHIPSEALESSVEITIEMLDFPQLITESNFFHLNVYKFSPADLIFSKDVEIWFPAINYESLTGYFCSEENWKEFTQEKIWEKISNNRVWEIIPAEITENYYAIIKTRKFGIYTAGYFL